MLNSDTIIIFILFVFIIIIYPMLFYNNLDVPSNKITGGNYEKEDIRDSIGY